MSVSAVSGNNNPVSSAATAATAIKSPVKVDSAAEETMESPAATAAEASKGDAQAARKLASEQHPAPAASAPPSPSASPDVGKSIDVVI